MADSMTEMFTRLFGTTPEQHAEFAKFAKAVAQDNLAKQAQERPEPTEWR
jgi:hypothetical protein